MIATRVSLGGLMAALAVGAAVLEPTDAEAFCGFYVSGGDAHLFNNATQVVLMREGIRTILSMQNNYQGPPMGFAMVVPVPVVLKQQNVKTLPPDLFAKIDQLSAPRLVEYWEQDPCRSPVYPGAPPVATAPGAAFDAAAAADGGAVKVEARFAVGEYQIVILSATEATALEGWLHDNQYQIPDGAAPLFGQYIQQGQYFFVAKVDPAKVTFKDGRAVLSPLRFDYDSESFSLPVRMGMVNSAGQQDLIVYIVSRQGRYEVANRPNVTIPTNIDVSLDVGRDFPIFYSKLFTKTLEVDHDPVVTEYSWDGSTCDPCPGPALDPTDYATLGADTLGGATTPSFGYGGWTLTRLHARYGKGSLTDDLVFRPAPSIVGGREEYDPHGKLEQGASPQPGGYNNFQGRYIMRHPWTGPVQCANPQRGIWGGPPGGASMVPQGALSPNSQGGAAPAPATSPLGGRDLATLVNQSVPELGVTPTPMTPPLTPPPLAPPPPPPPGGAVPAHRASSGCAMAGPGAGLGAGLLVILVGGGVLARRRRGR